MSTAMRLHQLVRGQQAWRADTIDDSESWHHRLSESCLVELDAWIQDIAEEVLAITSYRLPQAAMTACAACLELIRAILFQGRGFVIIDQVPKHYTVEQARALFWGVGQLLGQPLVQNRQDALLYSVRDATPDSVERAHFSVTKAESSFHTDGAHLPHPPDLIGWLCLATAKLGGERQLISSYTLHNELLEKYPEALRTLYQDFYFDPRDGVLAQETPVVRHPILRWNGTELTMRYLRSDFHVAYANVDASLTTARQEALARLAVLLQRPDLRVEFQLQPGQMLFINNHWTLHNRTALVDYAEPERRRHYIRLWLQRQ